jgi:putative SOS response-associated peptidase YedK
MRFMCGRYMMTSPLEAVRQYFKVTSGLNLPPRYNIAPTQPVPVVFKDDRGERSLIPMRWGLVPSWAKEVPAERPLINARGESVAEKPSFRAAYQRRRAIVPANGFYEWQKQAKGGKQPMFIHLEDQRLFGFAGIWEMWQGPDGGSALQSVAIITRDAYPEIAHLHDRMPIILNEQSHAAWLNAEVEAMDAAILVKAEEFHWHPISTRVNRVAEDDEALITPTEEFQEGVDEGSQLSLF